MKKSILTMSVLAGLAACVYGQGVLGAAGSFTATADLYGSFTLDNTENGPSTITATANGLVWIGNTVGSATLLDPSNPLGQDVNVAVYDGSSLVVSMTLNTNPDGSPATFPNGSAASDAIGGGLFLDNSSTTYYDSLQAGGATATLTLDMWTGNYATYALAVASGLPTVYAATATFSQPLGNGGSPAGTATDFGNMPAMVLLPPVPEPTTIALATLGGISLLALRRRKAA